MSQPRRGGWTYMLALLMLPFSVLTVEAAARGHGGKRHAGHRHGGRHVAVNRAVLLQQLRQAQRRALIEQLELLMKRKMARHHGGHKGHHAAGARPGKGKQHAQPRKGHHGRKRPGALPGGNGNVILVLKIKEVIRAGGHKVGGRVGHGHKGVRIAHHGKKKGHAGALLGQGRGRRQF